MAELLPVPEVAAGATEVVLSQWLVKTGAQFKAGDPLAMIETEKAAVEIEAETDAILLRALAAEGSEIAVGSPMALLGSDQDADADTDTLLAELGASAVGGNHAPPRREVLEDQRESSAPDTGTDSQRPHQGGEPAAFDTPVSERRFISPIARKLLREAELDAMTITGTGPNGRIRRRDVEAAIAASKQVGSAEQTSSPAPAGKPEPPVTAVEQQPWTDVPHSRLRRAVATRLTESKQRIPHFYVRRSVRLDDLLTLRTQLNEGAPTKLSVNDFFIRAIAVAHTQVPEANVIWTDQALRQYDTADVAVAIDSERGLVTPVLRGVDKDSLSTISIQVKNFVEQANSGRLQQQDLEGGSISISNLGMYDVDEFSAIINPPQSAILAVGAGRPTVEAVDGQPTVVTTANLVLSVDHRAIDGALAARWMGVLVRALENPLRLVV